MEKSIDKGTNKKVCAFILVYKYSQKTSTGIVVSKMIFQNLF